jgi:hypothetical protein
MLKEVIDVIKLIIDKMGAWHNSSKEEKAKKVASVFKEVVIPSFEKLEIIHHDYSVNLTALRQHLINRSLPPRELIQWLQSLGIEYRKDRIFLMTIDEEFKRFSDPQVDPTSDIASEFYWNLQLFVIAVMNYCHCTTEYNEISYYRDFEASLNVLLKRTQNSNPKTDESAKDLFYSAPEVQDMCDTLLLVCDKYLPRAWEQVSRAFRGTQLVAGEA